MSPKVLLNLLGYTMYFNIICPAPELHITLITDDSAGNYLDDNIKDVIIYNTSKLKIFYNPLSCNAC
jgi:hypothetical protein